MWSLFFQAFILGTHLELLLAQAFGTNFGYSNSDLMLGNTESIGRTYQYESEPVLLNCFSKLFDQQGKATSQLTVNILPRHGASSPRGLYGYGDDTGAPGKSRGRLSARIQLSSNQKDAGKVYVFITERARVRNGCSNEKFGKILSSDKDGARHEWGFGQAVYGLGTGYSPASYGWGQEYKTNYGYGNSAAGYGPGLGFGYTNGLGLGYAPGSVYGLGFGIGGLGMGFGSARGVTEDGQLFGRKGSDEGAITVLNLTPGALISAEVDNIGFDDLSDLAGRGVMICSGIDYDSNWNPICAEPIHSCCSLKYDNVELSLVGP